MAPRAHSRRVLLWCVALATVAAACTSADGGAPSAPGAVAAAADSAQPSSSTATAVVAVTASMTPLPGAGVGAGPAAAGGDVVATLQAARNRTAGEVQRTGRLAGRATVIDDGTGELDPIATGTYQVTFELGATSPQRWVGRAEVDGRAHRVELGWPVPAVGPEGYLGGVCVDDVCTPPTVASTPDNDRAVLFNVFNYELLVLTVPGGDAGRDLRSITGAGVLPGGGPSGGAGSDGGFERQRGIDGAARYRYTWFGSRPWPAVSAVSERGCELAQARLSLGVFRSLVLDVDGCGTAAALGPSDLPVLEADDAYRPADALALSAARPTLVQRATEAGRYALDAELAVSPSLAADYGLTVGSRQVRLELALGGAPGRWEGFGVIDGGAPVPVVMDLGQAGSPLLCVAGRCDSTLDGTVLDNLWVVLAWTAQTFAASAVVAAPAEVSSGGVAGSGVPTLRWNIRLAQRGPDGSLLWSDHEDRWSGQAIVGSRRLAYATSAEGCETAQALRHDDGGSYLLRHRVPNCGDPDLVSADTLWQAAAAWPAPL